MNRNIKDFGFPVPVIQVYKNVYLYGKDSKSSNIREKNLDWREMNSSNGFIQHNELFLPQSFSDFPISNHKFVLLLVDENLPLQGNHANNSVLLSRSELNPLILDVPRDFEIFHLNKKVEFEISLNYSYFSIGLPSRDNFMLAPLILGEPLEIKINGKIDHNLSSSRARLFKEQHYIFHYLGDFKSTTLLAPNQITRVKEVPKLLKSINLIKPLW